MGWEDYYQHLREIPNQGVCGIAPMLFTIGLFCNLSDVGYSYRYCYENYVDAFDALQNWNGEEHPPGPWIKRKGDGGEIRNE